MQINLGQQVPAGCGGFLSGEQTDHAACALHAFTHYTLPDSSTRTYDLFFSASIAPHVVGFF